MKGAARRSRNEIKAIRGVDSPHPSTPSARSGQAFDTLRANGGQAVSAILFRRSGGRAGWGRW